MNSYKKWFQKGTAALLAVSLLIGQAMSAGAAKAAVKQEESLKIASLSDTHYLSPDMIKDTADFTKHLNSDRKMFAESDAFLTGLLDTIKEDDPDVLLISGDLTKDGEKEAHEDLAAKLLKFKNEEMPNLHIYITPGNHDLNNSNAMNFNTPDGVAVPAGRTTQQDYREIYADLTYNDETVIAQFQPAEGKQGGGLSYVARPKDGFTIVSIDSARYSADNTDSKTDEHETSGAIGKDLEKWVVEQIAAAKERGDTVIGLQHHGLISHFSMEPEILPMYLVNDYERLSQVFADAGMQYVFTGHMHANDIASMTTQQGNTLYDIETGSVVTYPSPARTVTITRTIENGTVKENMEVKTHTGVGPITFTNPVTGAEQTIEDISAYGKEHGFSNDMLSTTVNGFLHDYYAQIVNAGGIRNVLVSLVNDATGMSFSSFDQVLDVGLPLLLPKEEGATIYYDSAKGGLVIALTDPLSLNLLIPIDGLKQTLNLLLDKADEEIENPKQLDTIVEKLVAALTEVPVSEGKSLLDYVNYIYQSHLGGEDSQEQPAWVTEATGKIQSGELLNQVIGILVQEVAGVIDGVCANLSLGEILGANAWNNGSTEGEINSFVAIDGRTPLVFALDESSGNVMSMLFTRMGVGWEKDPEDSNILMMPEGSNPEVGYSVADFLDALKGSFTGTIIGIKDDFSFVTVVDELLNGTPATEDAPATEGLLTEEMKGQLNTWLLKLVDSMGTDSNFPQDNDASIYYEWKLTTDRTALDEAIANAEKLDLSQYTAESAQVVRDVLAAAKELSLTATQEEMDQAAAAIDSAIKALKKAETPGNPETPGDPGVPSDPEAPSAPGETPQTGDSSSALPFMLLVISGGCLIAAIVLRKCKAQKNMVK